MTSIRCKLGLHSYKKFVAPKEALEKEIDLYGNCSRCDEPITIRLHPFGAGYWTEVVESRIEIKEHNI